MIKQNYFRLLCVVFVVDLSPTLSSVDTLASSCVPRWFTSSDTSASSWLPDLDHVVHRGWRFELQASSERYEPTYQAIDEHLRVESVRPPRDLQRHLEEHQVRVDGRPDRVSDQFPDHVRG